MKAQFPIFTSHLDLTKVWWAQIAQEGDWAVDATCGNGHDTLALSHLFSGVIGLDIQPEAISATTALLKAHGEEAELYCQGHETFPSRTREVPIRLIVYNLGYLPGGDKGVTTRVETTLKSVEGAMDLILPGGMVSITCYPGHEEGAREATALLEIFESLDPAMWSCSKHAWKNRKNAPHILLIQKNI